MEVKDARERKQTKFIHKETKGKKTTVVYQVAKGNKGDSRLYKGEFSSSRPQTSEFGAKSKARYKSNTTPADSLSRADYAKLKEVKKPLKKKGFFGRRKK
jgi:hypothetical protein